MSVASRGRWRDGDTESRFIEAIDAGTALSHPEYSMSLLRSRSKPSVNDISPVGERILIACRTASVGWRYGGDRSG